MFFCKLFFYYVSLKSNFFLKWISNEYCRARKLDYNTDDLVGSDDWKIFPWVIRATAFFGG